MLDVADAVEEFVAFFVVKVLHGSTGHHEWVIGVEDLTLGAGKSDR